MFKGVRGADRATLHSPGTPIRIAENFGQQVFVFASCHAVGGSPMADGTDRATAGSSDAAKVVLDKSVVLRGLEIDAGDDGVCVCV